MKYLWVISEVQNFKKSYEEGVASWISTLAQAYKRMPGKGEVSLNYDLPCTCHGWGIQLSIFFHTEVRLLKIQIYTKLFVEAYRLGF